MKVRGGDPIKTRALQEAKTPAASAEARPAGHASEASAAPSALQPLEAQSPGAKQALRALALDVRSPEQPDENKGAEASTFGAKLMAFTRSQSFRRAGAMAALGLSLLGTAQQARADTIFLDFNNGVKEIETARQLAAEKGEKFVLVRPTVDALEEVFAKAERGEIDLRHLILSGHSGGTSIWGSGPAGERFSADINQFRELKKKYPNAFAQVEHVSFMACYAGGEGNSATWNEVFNNARAIVGFYGSGPASHRPASSWVLKNVERELRRLPDATLSPQDALIRAKRMTSLDGPRHTKFGIRLDGVYYKAGQQTTSSDLVMQRVQFNRNQTYVPYFEAQPGRESPPTNHQTSPLRDFYNQLQEAVNHVETGSAESESLQKDIRSTIRLIYFDNVVKNVQLEHGATFRDANQQLRELGAGFEIPSDLKTKTRAELLRTGDQLAELGDVDLKLFVAGQADTVTEVNAFFASRGLDYRYELPADGPSWQLRTGVNTLEIQLSDSYFSSAEKQLVRTLQSELDVVKRQSRSEREQAAVNDAAQSLLGGRLDSYLQDAQSTVSLPKSVEAASRLGLDGLRQLSQQLRQEARRVGGWQQGHIEDVANHLDKLLGTGGDYSESLAVRRVLSRHESDIANINVKLASLGSSARVDGADKLNGAAGVLQNALREMDRFAAPPAALLEKVSALRAGIEAPPPTAVGDAARLFKDALRDLNPDAVPDNWITD